MPNDPLLQSSEIMLHANRAASPTQRWLSDKAKADLMVDAVRPRKVVLHRSHDVLFHAPQDKGAPQELTDAIDQELSSWKTAYNAKKERERREKAEMEKATAAKSSFDDDRNIPTMKITSATAWDEKSSVLGKPGGSSSSHVALPAVSGKKIQSDHLQSLVNTLSEMAINLGDTTTSTLNDTASSAATHRPSGSFRVPQLGTTLRTDDDGKLVTSFEVRRKRSKIPMTRSAAATLVRKKKPTSRSTHYPTPRAPEEVITPRRARQQESKQDRDAVDEFNVKMGFKPQTDFSNVYTMDVVKRRMEEDAERARIKAQLLEQQQQRRASAKELLMLRSESGSPVVAGSPLVPRPPLTARPQGSAGSTSNRGDALGSQFVALAQNGPPQSARQ